MNADPGRDQACTAWDTCELVGFRGTVRYMNTSDEVFRLIFVNLSLVRPHITWIQWYMVR